MKQKSILLGVLIALFAFLPMVDVKAETTVTVNNQAELKDAIAKQDVSTIILGQDIKTTEKINILRPLTIDGNHHKMEYVGTFGSSGSKDKTVWGGIYVLQVYKTNATIKDITLTGGNAALLVNGANVKLVGTIDVSGNGFGGIELGQGQNVASNAHLSLGTGTTIVNTTETSDKPTIWVPEDSTNAVLEINGVKRTLSENQEIFLEEINKALLPETNPDTSDSILLSVWSAIVGFGIIMYTRKKLFS